MIRYDKRGADARTRAACGAWAAALGARATRGPCCPTAHGGAAALALLAGIPRAGRLRRQPRRRSRTAPGVSERPARGTRWSGCLALAGPGAAPAPPVRLGTHRGGSCRGRRLARARGIGAGFVALAPGSIWGTKRWPYYPELAAALGTTDRRHRWPGGRGAGRRGGGRGAGRAHSAAGELEPPRVRGAHRAGGGAGHQRFGAAAPGDGRRHADGGHVRADGAGASGSARAARADRMSGVHRSPAVPARPTGPRSARWVHHRCMRDLSVEQVAEAVAAAATPEDRRAIRPGH